MNMKKMILSSMVCLLLLAGCGSMDGEMDQAAELTAQERTQLYETAIRGARDQETNEAMTILTSAEEDQGQAVFDMLGLKPEDVEACALSVSLMNVKAYGIAAVYPVAGREEAVRNGLNDFMVAQKGSFEQYLQDQFDIADKAKLGVLKDGTILLVMCENQDAVYESIKTTIEAAA